MTQVRKSLKAPDTAAPPPTPRAAAKRRGPLDSLLDPALFAALSDPTRLRLLACIAKCGRGCTVGETADCCAVDLSVVSRHLSLLARAGVLTPAREGRVVRYIVRYDELATLFRSLADALDCCRPTDITRCCSTTCSEGACDAT
jgi:ArsR family transcriptional regulator